MALRKKITHLLVRRNISASSGVVFLIDVIFALFSVFAAFMLVLQFASGNPWNLLFFGIGIFVLRVFSFLFQRTYRGIVRYTGTADVLRIFGTLTVGAVILLVANGILYLVQREFAVPFLFLWIEYSILLCLMVFSRLVFKLLFAHNFRRSRQKKSVIIYGPSKYLILVKNLIRNTNKPAFTIKAFIDTDKRSAGKRLGGIRVYSIDELDMLLSFEDIDSLIIARKYDSARSRKLLIDSCMEHKVRIKEIPRPEDLITGKFSLEQLRNLRIEDLLQRDVIELDEDHLERQLKDKTIMVTGAVGSIGSEIVRQLTRFLPGQIILVDIAESPLYELELELQEKYNFFNFSSEMSDIRNKPCMEKLFERYRPHVVYHAAAYKHVPMIEKKPLEGLHTNVLGTRNIADLSDQYGCEKFVMVSTDKAVNPTNVMGCTKRIAEIYIQSLNKTSRTAFVTTRFGNVLGSNGSVVPRFMKQIEEGGPVTVTHPDITRFFMTIPEACQLVLQAGALGNGGEIFVFDMGESVKIVDLAKKMIRLSGQEEDLDIEIVFTGLRPGEKLYEEVLNEKEKVLPTVHSRINRAKVREYDYQEVSQTLTKLGKQVLEQGEEWEAVRSMKKIVPEFKSKNSRFSEIDREMEEPLTPNSSKETQPAFCELLTREPALIP